MKAHINGITVEGKPKLSKYDYIDYKAPLYVRIAAKIISRFLADCGLKGFQGVGEKNWECGENKVDVIMPTEEVIQWIGFATGKRKNLEQIRKEYGMYH